MSNPQKKSIERYVAFYFVEGFWAEAKPDYSKYGSEYWLTTQFMNLMGENITTAFTDTRKVTVCRDGMVMYSDNELQSSPDIQGNLYQRIEKYTDILNALFCVFNAKVVESTKIKVFQSFEITHNDIVPITFEDGCFSSMGIPQKSMLISQLNKRFLSYAPALYVDSLDMYIDQHPRVVLSIRLLNEIIQTFFRATNSIGNIRLLARANKAAAEFEGTSFSDCLLIAWTLIEMYIFDQLEVYVHKADSTRFNLERREYLTKKITTSEALELLEIAGIISMQEYKDLSKLRKARNKIIHEGATASFEQASSALTMIEKVIQVKTGCSIKINKGIGTQIF